MSKRISKMLFSKERVELGIIQDIIKVFREGRDQFTTAASMEDRALEEYSNSLKTLLQAQKLSEKAKSDAKSLGVEIPNETQRIFNQIDEFIREAQKKK
jgi:hypothetical protein|tara:strand:- start:545 stop:841 length:297 start_codon:yes stop_codon:yes gene_type:complete